MSGTADPGQDPAVTTTEETAPVQGEQPTAPAQGASGPWADQVGQRFADPEVRGAVDEFLRTTVQPYVTRLEQSRNTDAEQLYEMLNERPGDAYMAITEELFGEEAAQAVLNILNNQSGKTEPAQQTPAPAEGESLDPRVQRVVTAYEDQQRREAYDAELSQLKTANPDVPIQDALFAPFVMAADGDFGVALNGYKQFVEQASSQFGAAPADTTEQQTETAPPAIGSDTQATTAPPVQKKYTSIDEALDDFFAESKSPAPQSVGVT